MILQAIVDIFVLGLRAILRVVWALIPSPPAWAGDGFIATQWAWDFLHQFEAWLPIDMAFTVMGAVFGAYTVTIIAELTRMILSYMTFGGGAK